MATVQSSIRADANDDDDTALRNALYLSTLESSKHKPWGKSYGEVISPEAELTRLRQSNALVLLAATDADTLVVIGVPPQQPDQTDKAYSPIARHFATFHKIHSGNLLTLGSAKLTGLLGPTSQYRTERRLRNEGVLPGGKPRGIKYLLDLRPPREGEDAVVLITELTCSSGILTWFKAQKKYRIPRTLVCGQDDSSLLLDHQSNSSSPRNQSNASKKQPHKPHADFSSSQSHVDSTQKASKESKPVRIGNWAGVLPTAPVIPDEAADHEEYFHVTDNAGIDQKTTQASLPTAMNAASAQEPKIEPEYSQLRHCSAIERLLHAIEGKDPMLDSAPKLWTFCAVANYFGCATNERVSGWITTWLFTAPNHNFIQCNPEVCYRIGLGIQSEVLIKDAFSLLVGEKALINVHRENLQVRSSSLQHSVAGRKLGMLDDDELNRIDHAANVLVRRIQSKYDALISEDMMWLERSRTFRSLTTFVPKSTSEENIARLLKKHVKDFVRSRVIWVVGRDYKADMPQMEHAPEKVRPFYHHALAQFLVYNELSNDERIFTRFFWMALRQERLELGDSSLFTHPPWRSGHVDTAVSPSPGWSRLARKLQNDGPQGNMLMVHKATLYSWAIKFENILRGRRSLAKANSIGDWSDDEMSGGGTCRHTFANDACPKTQSPEADPRDPFSYDKPAANFTPGEFRYLQLSPKRIRGANHPSDLVDKKRARVDVHNTHGDSGKLGDKKFELPIHVAASKNGEKLEPTEGSKTIKVAKLQTVEDPRALGARFAYMDMEVPIPEETESSISKPDASENVLGEHSGSNEERRQQVPKPADEARFSVDVLLVEITHAMHGVCDELLLAVQFFGDGEVPPTDLIDSLLCLTDEEWKYLPLWAGGNDDGSGGVFQDADLPILETGGFAGGRRGLGHQGDCSGPGSSDWTDIVSTVAKASRKATDGSLDESATVQSFDDVDMDVRSLDDESSLQDTDTLADLDAFSIQNLDSDDQNENEYDEDDDDDHDGVSVKNVDTEDAEEAGWDDCNV